MRNCLVVNTVFAPLCWALALLWGAQTASAQMYAADLASSEWKTTATPFSCSLVHKIPAFGKAVLARKAGGAETLVLELEGKAAFPPGLTGIETLPPVWRNDLAPQGLGVVVAGTGNQLLSLDPSRLTPVIEQLNKGMKVMFTSQPVSNASSSAGLKVVRVVLEAKNFAPAYKGYQQCLADMIPYSLAQVARTAINYAEKPDGLTQAHKASLLRAARYLKADPKVVAVFVDGHSDNGASPEANLATSQQQAEAVTAFLREQGVPEGKITTRWHGDKFPIADNKAPSGRAQNRRVTVRLEDEATRAQNEKKAAQKAEQKAKAEEQARIEEKAKAEEQSKRAQAAQEAKAEQSLADEVAASFKAGQPKPDSHSAPPAPSSSAAAEPTGVAPNRKLTPEQLNRMVEGLDVVTNKPK